MPTLALALADCLEALEGNPADLEACIAKYSGHQEELDALLHVAKTLKEPPVKAVPRDGFLDDLRSTLMKKFPPNHATGGETE